MGIMKSMRSIFWNYGLPFVRWLFRLTGQDWNAFYTWLLNRLERDNSLEQIFEKYPSNSGKERGLYDWSRGEYHVEFLQRLGLKPHHKVFDFGCGYGRTGIPLAKYLDAGNYIGVDLSGRRIEMAEEWVKKEGIEQKNPVFLTRSDNKLSWLDDKSIDVIFTYSVFTHMPKDDMIEILVASRRVLKDDGMFIFNYSKSYSDVLEQPSIKDFRYPAQEIYDMLDTLGYDYEERTDWDDDLEDGKKSPVSKVLKLTKKQTA
ncbi:MAG: hypothetical protein CMM78_06810 [Rhodospirillaceae bacterium]|jgi:ubiquinone/menaquinone biosynthesis C-methylase UbiE|uniref:class I SAM-dependent methyltransferase n=1 Tax=Hwanghaeella sp. 1Z406 TaxID=3402811 RepID=UPI000C53FBBF|nr:hypothetical protein [Rhodospirillales bacterium]MAX47904.1 hypothetical protein [Rhodospirillaceae bacterium]|tara:strand:+ start:2385 stop:3161 length:777 start_codon:yes stop_codon:yes gene_type:complete